MHRISSLVKSASSSSSSARLGEIALDDDAKSATSTVVRDELAPVPSLKVKRVDYYYSRWTKSWKYRVTLLS